ncbi:MAG: tRNA (cytidine(34)-2'-O)-methyltransferase [Pseudomonadota bacterium]
MMHLAMYQPDIPQNVGAAIRVAACFGAQLNIIGPCGFPLDNRRLKRVAMDYESLAPPTAYDSWDVFLTQRNKGRIVLLTTKARETVWDYKFQPDDILLLGRESEGAPAEVHEAADERIKIPMAEGARSLNIAVSAAVALAEARRQLGWSDT